MATLFGTAGAGLAGYKMMKRTRGLQEFQFEYCPDGVFQAEKGKDSNERKEQSDSAEKNWKVHFYISILMYYIYSFFSMLFRSPLL